MNAKELKKLYGEEYPAALTVDGVRMPLSRETRFSRHYDSAERNTGTIISRFMDGSASVTLSELERDWPAWTEAERWDFCQECSWLHEQADFPDMLRFVMKNGCHQEWSAIALSIASHLPQQEAFDFLLAALGAADTGRTSNLGQAISITKHADAENVLRDHLKRIWDHKSLWDDDKFVNWVAFDATTCVTHLLELAVSTDDFEEQVRSLSQHVCSRNRDSCRNFLSKHYSWLR